MKTSENIDQIAAALLEAQKAMPLITKDAVNPHLKTQYASLIQVRDAVVPTFHKHGISVIQSGAIHETVSDGFAVTSRLLHTSGQWIETTTPVYVSKKDAQGVGSATTYGRRYSLLALAGVTAEDDDDGAAASGTDERPKLHKEKPFPKGAKHITAAVVEQIEELMRLLATTAEERHIAVTWACDSRTDNVNNLTDEEGDQLLRGLQKKVETRGLARA